MNDLEAPPVEETVVGDAAVGGDTGDTDTQGAADDAGTQDSSVEDVPAADGSVSEAGALDVDATGAAPVSPAVDAAPVTPKAPEPAKPAAAQPDPAKVEAERQYTQRVDKFNADFGAIRQKIAAGTFDAYEDPGATMKTLVEGIELLATELGRVDGTAKQISETTTQSQAYEKSWDQWAAANPDVGRKLGEQWMGEEGAKVRAQYPDFDERTAAAVAHDRFMTRVATEKLKRGKAPATPAKPASNNPPSPRASTQVAPKGGTARPAAKPETAAETLLRTIGPVSKVKLY